MAEIKDGCELDLPLFQTAFLDIKILKFYGFTFLLMSGFQIFCIFAAEIFRIGTTAFLLLLPAVLEFFVFIGDSFLATPFYLIKAASLADKQGQL